MKIIATLLLTIVLIYGIMKSKSELRRSELLSSKCPPTKMVNLSKEAWVAHDYKTKKLMKKRCRIKFSETNKCLKLFRKTAPRAYQVICGR